MSCRQGCWCFPSFLPPRLRVLYLLNQDERASNGGGAYGTPFNRIICAGVSKGPLVCSLHLRVSGDVKDDDDGGVDRSGDGVGC